VGDDGEAPRLAVFCEVVIGLEAEGGVFRRRRSKHNNIPKSANPTTPPTTPPAIAPTFVVLGLGLELAVVVPVVVVGEIVDLGGAVDSGPPAFYLRGLDQRR
jgi:hypothetical protein